MKALAGALCLLAFSLAAHSAEAQGRGGQAGDFDFYVLSLSWSPSYCADAGERADRMQCGTGKAFAFVTHGLWPQYERGFPSDCRVTGRNPTRAQVDGILDIMPSPGLVRHEWRKHGTCSGLDPASYFGQVRAAYDKVVIPDALKSADEERDMSPADIERAFVDANRGMKPSGIAVACKDGALQEVRICMTEGLDFRPCAEVDRKACRSSRISVPAAGSR